MSWIEFLLCLLVTIQAETAGWWEEVEQGTIETIPNYDIYRYPLIIQTQIGYHDTGL